VDIVTERLVLRDWRESDLAPWAAMNADPAVREHLGPLLTAEQATSSVHRFQRDIERNGFGLWAAEARGTGEFIGFTGLDQVDDGSPVRGVEVGWRLARAAWGHGYATEGARAALEYGFGSMTLAEILAITVAGNVRSQAVMRRLGMTHNPQDDFDDLSEPEGPLRRQIVYRIAMRA
jgi:RimJ/RimL family protein N-acetyltransferase